MEQIKLKLFMYLSVLGIGIVIYFIMGYCIDESNIQLRKEFVLKSLHGRITEIKSGSRGKTEFQLNTEEEGHGHYLEKDYGIFDTEYNMYQFAEVGDSIAKDTNTAYLKLIKKNGEEIWFKMVEH